MPEISRFFGIVIRMFAEPATRHRRPRFHAYYQDAAAVFGIEPVELISGHLPRPQQRLVEAWSEIHRAELTADWERLQAGQAPFKIDPLR